VHDHPLPILAFFASIRNKEGKGDSFLTPLQAHPHEAVLPPLEDQGAGEVHLEGPGSVPTNSPSILRPRFWMSLLASALEGVRPAKVKKPGHPDAAFLQLGSGDLHLGDLLGDAPLLATSS
jgi:hypothetical protein